MDLCRTLPEANLASGGNDLAVDVAVVGAGPTGLMAALGASRAGWRVALVAPRAPADPRTTALLKPAIEMLDEFGVWGALEEACAPLASMRIVDDTGRIPRAPEIVFDAHEIGEEAFGWNVPNAALNAALETALPRDCVVRVEAPVDRFEPGECHRLETPHEAMSADLVVAADGAQSRVRTDAGFGARRWGYDQAALVTTLSHQRPHGNVSTEFHTAAGPFTLVPLPGHRSSLVWVGRPDEMDAFAALDDQMLGAEVAVRAHNTLGPMTVDGPRGVIALGGLLAHPFGRDGVVLVGEAAHRFPPIGAQGLNLGFRDVAVLSALLKEARAGKTLADVARRYDVRRRFDIGSRTVGVDLLNRSLLTGLLPVSLARTGALVAARRIGPLRRAMMRVGLAGR